MGGWVSSEIWGVIDTAGLATEGTEQTEGTWEVAKDWHFDSAQDMLGKKRRKWREGRCRKQDPGTSGGG